MRAPLILIADDDVGYLEVVSDMLTGPFSVITAHDGEEALNTAMKVHPDLILLDINMPKLNGAQICKLLKNDPRTKYIAVVLVTGSNSPEDLASGFEAGADDYLIKPYNATELKARCKSVLKMKYLTDQLRESNKTLEERVAKQIQKIQQISQLQRYFSPKMIERIIHSNNENQIAFGDVPVRKEVTILFCDIREFTQLADRLNPEEIKSLLDSYLALITEVIFKYSGTINKFLGDGVLAVFGDPVDLDNSAINAIQAATEIRDRLNEFQPVSLPQNYNLRIGFGVHSGSVVIGNLGVGQHLDYTVIGAAVNMAARLQAYSTKNEIICTLSSLEGAEENFEVSNQRSVRIKGFREDIRIAEVRYKSGSDENQRKATK